MSTKEWSGMISLIMAVAAWLHPLPVLSCASRVKLIFLLRSKYL